MTGPADGEDILTLDAAYRAGLCVDCRGRRHSAGRPRCDTCHETYWAAMVNGGRPK